MKKLSKKLLAMTLCALLAIGLLAGCGSKEEETNQGTSTDASTEQTHALTPVVLNEVAHSIFYAPMYVAIEEGYFKEQGIDLTLVTGFGADKTMTALLSGEADIGFMGPETTVYAYNQGASDVVLNFAQLTQRAGNFLVAREKSTDFQWNDLTGSTVLGGRDGGMPEMVFEYVLKQKGIDPVKDLSINKSIDFGSTAAAFSGGQADYTVEFEPSATALEKEGAGYVIASIGVESGYVPYTAFSAKESYLKENADVVRGFVAALKQGMEYVNTHSPEEVAAVIAPQFSDTDTETIATIIERYQSQDTWKTDLAFSEDGYELLLDILEDADQLDSRPPYEALVTTEYVH